MFNREGSTLKTSSTMASTPTRHRPHHPCNRLASPSALKSAGSVSTVSGESSVSPLVLYKKSVPKHTQERLLQILTGPEQHIAHFQIYNQDPAVFGKPTSKLRKQVVNHRNYLQRLRTRHPEQYQAICLQHSINPPDQEAGEPSSMSYRNTGMCSVAGIHIDVSAAHLLFSRSSK